MVWRWSKTAASNASADSSINWAEGMAPSAVNDSARAEMARVAQWRDDISGAIVTTGTSTAYAVSSNQVFDTLAHMDGAMVAFTPHATNTGTATLNVDGLGTKPLRVSPGVEMPSGTVILGTPYVALYNNTDAAWYLHGGVSNPYSVPIGGMIDYIAGTAPSSNFIFPAGQAISRSTYASLFSLISTGYGAGDGSTTFNVPDLRGRVAVAADNMGGSAAGRWSGLVQASVGGNLNASTVIQQGNLPAVSYSLSGTPETITVQTNRSDLVVGAIGGNISYQGGGAGPVGTLGIPSFSTLVVSTGSYSPNGTIGPLGSNTAISTSMPYMGVLKILRVI